MWGEFSYCRTFHAAFNAAECEEIVTQHKALEPQSGSLPKARESTIYWLPRSEMTNWIFERIGHCVEKWNANYQFGLDPSKEHYLQLSRYEPGDRYDWHMDIGAGEMSKRKLSVVVELGDPARHGGGFEIFFGGDQNRVPLAQGSAVLFPSWIMHRAVTPITAERWSLAAWINGPTPFR